MIARTLDRVACALYRAHLPSGLIARAAAWCAAKAPRPVVTFDASCQGRRVPQH